VAASELQEHGGRSGPCERAAAGEQLARGGRPAVGVRRGQRARGAGGRTGVQCVIFHSFGFFLPASPLVLYAAVTRHPSPAVMPILTRR
jgi:hypothetical protein